jgi:hypothetical protein
MALEQQQAEADAHWRENQRAANEMRLSEMDMQNQMQLSQAEAQQKAELAQRDHEQNAELNRTKTIEDIKLKSQQFAQKSQMDEQAFRADQNRADVGFRSDEKRKDEAHKVKTENELRNQNESAEHERKATGCRSRQAQEVDCQGLARQRRENDRRGDFALMDARAIVCPGIQVNHFDLPEIGR